MALSALFGFREAIDLLQQIRLSCLFLYSSCRIFYCYGNDKNKNVAMSFTLNYVFPAFSKNRSKSQAVT